MTAKDLADVVAGVSPVIREFYTAQIAGVVTQMKAEQNALLDVILGLETRLAATEQRAVISGPPGPPGEKGTPGERGERGESGERGQMGEKGESGVAGEQGAIAPMGLTGPKGIDGAKGDQGDRGADGLSIVGKDGVGLTGALIDMAGHLVITLSDGTAKDVGLVVGRDVDMATVLRIVTEQIDQIPRPKDGTNGLDGLGFDDLDATYDEHGHMSLRFVRGDQVKTFRVPGHAHQDVWKDDIAYLMGDTVTWNNGMWTALKDSKGQQPGVSKAWNLSAHRGKPGQAGKDGAKGLDGKDGRAGRDLTHFDAGTGQKW